MAGNGTQNQGTPPPGGNTQAFPATTGGGAAFSTGVQNFTNFAPGGAPGGASNTTWPSGTQAPVSPNTPSPLPYDQNSYGGVTRAMESASGQFQRDANPYLNTANNLVNEAALPSIYSGVAETESRSFQQGARDNPYNPADYGDLNTYRDDVSNAFMNRQQSLLDPRFSQQREALEQDLADRGIPIGSEAHNDAMGNMNREHFDMSQRIANDAVLAGGAESARQLGMERSINDAAFSQGMGVYGARMTDRGQVADMLGQGFGQRSAANTTGFGLAQGAHEQYQNDISRQISTEQALRSSRLQEDLTAHQQNMSDINQRYGMESDSRRRAIDEEILRRNQAANELAMLLGQAPAMPLPQSPGLPNYNIQAPDIQGLEMAAYNAKLNNYNSQVASKNSGVGGAFGLASSLIGAFSDEAMKTNIKPATSLCDLAKSMPVKVWEYKPETGFGTEPHIGPMAGDWHKATGLGDGRLINPLDVIGFTLGCVQELAARVEKIEAGAHP